VDAEDETPADEKTSEEFWAQDESQLKLDPPPAPAAEDEAAAPDYAAFKGVKFSE
jgi:divIVA protein